MQSRLELKPLAGKAQVQIGGGRGDRLHRAKRRLGRALRNVLAGIRHRHRTEEMIGVNVINDRRGRDRIDDRDREIVQPGILALRHPARAGEGDDVIDRLRRRRSASFSIPPISMQARLDSGLFLRRKLGQFAVEPGVLDAGSSCAKMPFHRFDRILC